MVAGMSIRMQELLGGWRACVLVLMLLIAVAWPAHRVDAKAAVFGSACNHAISLDLISSSPAITQSGTLMYADSVPCSRAAITGQSWLFGTLLQWGINCVVTVPGSYLFATGYGTPNQSIAGSGTGSHCNQAWNSVTW